jgi:hypothetical protein
MKLEIVKINDKYALRRKRLIIFTDYKDLVSRNFWWRRSSRWFKDCLGTFKKVEDSVEKMKKEMEQTEEVIKRVN